MKTGLKKAGLLLFGSLMMCSLLTGCKASKKKVLSSTYYKELKKEKQKLEKENKKLKEEIDKKDEPTADEQRAEAYLEKIGRDRLVKLEVGWTDNMDGSEFIEDEAVFSLATAIAKRADTTTRYTPEQIQEKYGSGYGYVLYDEDNAIYELEVYGDGYVIFKDLPNNVFYAENAAALGEAFLHYRDGYPNSRLLHRLADSAVVTDDSGNCYENDAAFQAANAIDKMDKKKTDREAAETAWKKKAGEEKTAAGEYIPKNTQYIFYHHGNHMVLTLYDTYICIENMDESRTWYKVEKGDIKALKKIFKESALEIEAETEQTEGGAAAEDAPSHETEIEEESIISNGES